jgi:DNA ligase (NAD+)
VGQHVAKVLAREFGSLEAIMAADQDRFQAIKEIGPEISASLVSYFQEDSNRRVIRRLRELGLSLVERSAAQVGALLPFTGKSFVFTGELEALRRDQAKAVVEQLGATVSSGVSRKTTYLVAGADPGSKLDHARKLGVTILGEQEFLELMKSQAEP